MRQSPRQPTAVAPDTIRCKVTDVGFMPIPGPYDQTIAGLLSVQLPPGVQSGSEYTVVMRQVAGRTFKVLGTTEFRIRVGHAAELLPGKLHDLSVLRYVAAAIPAGNRWEPVFARYLGELEDRIRAFGGDPDDAVPSPTGHPGGADGGPGDGDGHADVVPQRPRRSVVLRLPGRLRGLRAPPLRRHHPHPGMRTRHRACGAHRLRTQPRAHDPPPPR